MRLGVSLLPANLAFTGGIAIYGQSVMVIGTLGLSVVCAKMSFLDLSPGGSYAYARRYLGPFFGYQTDILYWLVRWISSIVMVVIGVGYLSYFLPVPKDPLVLTITYVVVLWIFVLLNIVDPKMITRVQAAATVLVLVPIVGVAVFGWFWPRGKTYTAVWSVSGLGTFSAIQSTLNATLWLFIGVESASVAVGMVKNPKRNVSIATIGGVLIAAVCYVPSTTTIMGMTPNVVLRAFASPFGDAVRMVLGGTVGATISFHAAAGCSGSLGGWTLLAGQMMKAAADNGLLPSIFTCVNKAGTPVAGLIIVGILMIIFQLSSISPNATKEFGPVSSVSVTFTLVPYLYTCAALLLLGHGHSDKIRPAYLTVATIVFLYCIWAIVGSGAREVMWSFVTLMVVTAMYTLNYNQLHKSPYPLDALASKD